MSNRVRCCCDLIQPRNGRGRRWPVRPCIRRLPKRRACRRKLQGATRLRFRPNSRRRPPTLPRNARWATRSGGSRNAALRERSRYRSSRNVSRSRSARSRETARKARPRARSSKASRQEYTKLKPLADQGIVPFARVATLERSKADLEGRIGAHTRPTSRAIGRIIDEARLQINQVGQKVLEEAAAKLDRHPRPTRRCAREAARRCRRPRPNGSARTPLRTDREPEGPHDRRRDPTGRRLDGDRAGQRRPRGCRESILSRYQSRTSRLAHGSAASLIQGPLDSDRRRRGSFDCR